jgi:hypothetical protein
MFEFLVRSRSHALRQAMVLLAAGAASVAASAATPAWVVRPEWVKAHEDFLASTPLQGRGSATRDEAIAAAYVASEFERFGLKTAPGMSGYTQVAHIVRPRLSGKPALTLAGGGALTSLTLVTASGDVHGTYAVLGSADARAMPQSDIVVVTAPNANFRDLMAAAGPKHVKLVIIPATAEMQQMISRMGGVPRLRPYLEGSPPPETPALAMLSSSDIAMLAARRAGELTLSVPMVQEVAQTTNAIGYLPGTDPSAGNLLISAHLDHLGVVDGTLMPGANDDASGTTGVIELAHALSSGKPMRRGILFVCYGSEEIGEFGSRYFGEHPPVPLSSIVVNLELEMIGSQDPKLPAGHLMMTGFERSNFGEILQKNGALVSPDPYPEQHFFQRSDNYSLALKGIVAHTVSGWAVVPTYHQPTDTVANLNIPFMTRAIQSLVAPLRAIANGGETPHWKPGGQPTGEE